MFFFPVRDVKHGNSGILTIANAGTMANAGAVVECEEWDEHVEARVVVEDTTIAENVNSIVNLVQIKRSF